MVGQELQTSPRKNSSSINIIRRGLTTKLSLGRVGLGSVDCFGSGWGSVDCFGCPQGIYRFCSLRTATKPPPPPRILPHKNWQEIITSTRSRSKCILAISLSPHRAQDRQYHRRILPWLPCVPIHRIGSRTGTNGTGVSAGPSCP
jgi:hypothetical protein